MLVFTLSLSCRYHAAAADALSSCVLGISAASAAAARAADQPLVQSCGRSRDALKAAAKILLTTAEESLQVLPADSSAELKQIYQSRVDEMKRVYDVMGSAT